MERPVRMRTPVVEGQDLPVEQVAVTPEGGDLWRVAEFPERAAPICIGDVVGAVLRDDGDVTFSRVRVPVQRAETLVLLAEEPRRAELLGELLAAGALLTERDGQTVITMPGRATVHAAGRLIRQAEDSGRLAVIATEVTD